MSTTEICQNPSDVVRKYRFGIVLRTIRFRSGLTASEAARICGLNHKAYLGTESLKSSPRRMKTIQSLSKAYGELVWLICGFDTLLAIRVRLNEMPSVWIQNTVQE